MALGEKTVQSKSIVFVAVGYKWTKNCSYI